MPKIAEIKVVDADVWVRLEGGIFTDDVYNGMGIYTPYEIEQLKRDVALAISDQVLQMFPKPSR